MDNQSLLKKFTYKDFKYLSKGYLNVDTFIEGYAVLKNQSNILISAPHGVVQTQLGRHKVAEIGSARTALYLANATKSNLIIKTKNLFDNSNFDTDCSYRKEIARLIKQKDIKFLLDFHGLAKDRECDINLGINYGENIKSNKKVFEKILFVLKKAGFMVSIDNPFSGSFKTISGTFAREYNIFTIQIEINCGITNYESNFNKLKKLLYTFTDCIKILKNSKYN